MTFLPDYEAAVKAIDDLAMFAEKHTLSHTRRFLEVLGNPDEACPVVHVAGTNGKGSVCAFMERVLREAGLKTALFTSPHLTDIRERMRMNGEMISREEFVRVYQKVREAADFLKEREGLHEPSYFEYLYLMATVWFAGEGAEIVVTETGLGGRLDCTNTLRRPLVTVITSISLDHMQYLGHTVREIAEEKAGILKAAVPCVCAASDADAACVVENKARRMGIPVLLVGPADYKVLQKSHGAIDFSFSTRYDVGGPGVYTLAFAAPYQVENASLAIAALSLMKRQAALAAGEALSEEGTPKAEAALPKEGSLRGHTLAALSKLDAETVRRGLMKTTWAGRMEEILPDVYLDGAHNEDGIRRFTEAALSIAGDRRRILLFAAVADKDYTRMIAHLSANLKPAAVFVTEIAGKRRQAAEYFAEAFKDQGMTAVFSFPRVEEAFKAALGAREDGLLFICGSLYLVGLLKEALSAGGAGR